MLLFFAPRLGPATHRRNCNVISVLTYGFESWKITTSLEKKLNSFKNECLRNKQVREDTKQQYVSTTIRRKQWTYIRHVLRMNENRLPLQALKWVPDDKRKIGRPRETFHSQNNHQRGYDYGYQQHARITHSSITSLKLESSGFCPMHRIWR